MHMLGRTGTRHVEAPEGRLAREEPSFIPTIVQNTSSIHTNPHLRRALAQVSLNRTRRPRRNDIDKIGYAAYNYSGRGPLRRRPVTRRCILNPESPPRIIVYPDVTS